MNQERVRVHLLKQSNSYLPRSSVMAYRLSAPSSVVPMGPNVGPENWKSVRPLVQDQPNVFYVCMFGEHVGTNMMWSF